MKKNPARNVHLKKGPSRLLESINSSIDVDKRLYLEDIEASIAHTIMLGKQKIISKKDQTKIVKGLKSILKDIEVGKINIKIPYSQIFSKFTNYINPKKILFRITYFISIIKLKNLNIKVPFFFW